MLACLLKTLLRYFAQSEGGDGGINLSMIFSNKCIQILLFIKGTEAEIFIYKLLTNNKWQTETYLILLSSSKTIFYKMFV